MFPSLYWTLLSALSIFPPGCFQVEGKVLQGYQSLTASPPPLSPLFTPHPGGAPLFLSEKALQKIQRRKAPPATYNLDLNLVGDYWGWFGKRSYHHTGMVSTW